MRTVDSLHKIKFPLWLVYLFFVALAFLLFLPVLYKGFVSDDYLVLQRVTQRQLVTEGDFFRPLSDLSLYLSFWLTGMRPVGFNAVNILVHGSNAFMLYRLGVLSMPAAAKQGRLFGLMAAILFLLYPFHTEAVIWAIGRGIVLSAGFGLLALLVMLLPWKFSTRLPVACLLYFIALLGYETVLPLPFLFLLLMGGTGAKKGQLATAAAASLFTLLCYAVFKYYVIHVVVGDYGTRILAASPQDFILRAIKTTGRLLLPPSQQSIRLLSLAIALLVAIIVAVIIRKFKSGPEDRYGRLLVGLLIFSLPVPLLTGISTRTYEGDRIFYFCSAFLCLYISWLIRSVSSRGWRAVIYLGCVCYCLFFFYTAVLAWRRGGLIAQEFFMSVAAVPHPGAKLFLINVPEDHDGAQVLRNGFLEGLVSQHIDTAGIRVVNYLSSAQAKQAGGLIAPQVTNGSLFLYPSAWVGDSLLRARFRPDINYPDSVYFKLDKTDKIYFWNTKALVPLR